MPSTSQVLTYCKVHATAFVMEQPSERHWLQDKLPAAMVLADCQMHPLLVHWTSF